jgi:oxygen-independent coproporphyrinogen-3 oxidase
MTAESCRAAYIHVPFCRHRCGYCNFTLVAGRDDLAGAYLEALERELSWIERQRGPLALRVATDSRSEASTLGAREVDTLFFGGGTPTHLAPSQLERLFAIVRRQFPLAADGEFSVEANPIDLDAEKAAILQAAGVTRVSLGAQSFHQPKLRLLERDHTAADIERAFQFARNFADSVSLDLIFGAPGETLADWRRDLERALALSPDHVSTYGLTFEKGTAFWSRLEHGDLARVDEDLERQMYELAIDTLTAAGFEHYEVSNFARANHHCRHNENYWLGGQYFAAGPGAARFLAGKRETNHRSTTTYISRVLAGQSPVAESEQLGSEDAARERLVFALRRLEGIDTAEFAATGFSVEQLGGQALPRLIDQGFLSFKGQRLKLTRAGLLISDAIWPQFLRV